MLEKSRKFPVPNWPKIKDIGIDWGIEKMTGTVKRKAQGKNFGFIRTQEGVELFFHAGACIGKFEDFNEGDRVEFEPDLNNKKGPRAEQVRKL